MDKLSVSLQAKIKENPTQTFLKGEQDVDVIKNLKRTYKIKRHWIKVPDEFDGRVVWKGLLMPVINQGSCGACWAFASTSSLANRFNIQSMGLMNIQLSPTRLLLCYFDEKDFMLEADDSSNVIDIEADNLGENACFGNSLYNAWMYLFVVGTNTMECLPYNKKLGYNQDYKKLGFFEEISDLPLCDNISGPQGDMCNNYASDVKTGQEFGTPSRFYRALHYYYVPGIESDNGSEYQIRHNIYSWGPVSTAMQIYPDFYTFDFTSGIYEWNRKGPQVGGHAVEIVGWGTDKKSDKKYWIIENSWGDEWGENGYFKIIRGVNNCQIEQNVIGGIPDFFFPTSYNKLDKNLKSIGSESDISRKNRYELENKLDILAGGIDPETGYTRRTMSKYPWLDWSRPVNLEDLPNLNKFIAGLDATEANRLLFQSSIKQTCKDITYGKQSSYVTIFIICLIIVVLIGVFTILIFRKR
jgi:hypothetical protein